MNHKIYINQSPSSTVGPRRLVVASNENHNVLQFSEAFSAGPRAWRSYDDAFRFVCGVLTIIKVWDFSRKSSSSRVSFNLCRPNVWTSLIFYKLNLWYCSQSWPLWINHSYQVPFWSFTIKTNIPQNVFKAICVQSQFEDNDEKYIFVHLFISTFNRKVMCGILFCRQNWKRSGQTFSETCPGTPFSDLFCFWRLIYI